MRFQVAYHTDIGREKSTNQDSLGVLEAKTDEGRLLLAVLCDGMGGLDKGEVASAALIRAFEAWFQEVMPQKSAREKSRKIPSANQSPQNMCIYTPTHKF